MCLVEVFLKKLINENVQNIITYYHTNVKHRKLTSHNWDIFTLYNIQRLKGLLRVFKYKF